MADTLDPAVAHVVDVLDATSDPTERYQQVRQIETMIDAALKGVLQRIAVDLHDSGKPWRVVGEIMGGVSAQRAWQIARGE